MILSGTVDKIDDGVVSVEIPNLQLSKKVRTPTSEQISDTHMYLLTEPLIPCEIEEGSEIYLVIEPNKVIITCTLPSPTDYTAIPVPVYGYL